LAEGVKKGDVVENVFLVQAAAKGSHGASAARIGYLELALAHTFTWASFLHQFRRDPIRLREQAELAAGLARAQAIANNEAEASMLLGWLMAEEASPRKASA
jgi:hypothetical protein